MLAAIYVKSLSASYNFDWWNSTRADIPSVANKVNNGCRRRDFNAVRYFMLLSAGA